MVAALLMLLLVAPLPAVAQGPPANAKITRSAVNLTGVHPGQKAMAAVELEIKEGFHAQSRTPLAEELIEFEINLDENDAVTFGEPVFPEGHIENYPVLGRVSVYTGKVVVRVPFEVKADAPPGPLKISGNLYYQLCDDKLCFAPEKSKFTIETTIVPAGEEVKPNEPELFEEEEAAASAGSGTPLQIFGRTLDSDAYVLAFLGAFVVGLIFNIVPCVLPVLPLKAIGFYEVSQHNRAKCLAFGAVFSIGVIASFAVLGLFVVVLKWFKWGELFSNPWFLGTLILILVVMALSMFGVFTVNLPTKVYAFSPRHDTYLGNFLFGILTAVLSTPCTFGMFIGLLTWALTQPTAIGMALMVTVGAGMASPYFVLSAFPELARRFPRTGRWSELVKQLMGFLLLLVAAYFAKPWIERLIRPEAFWWTLFGIVAAAALFLVVRTFQFSPRTGPRLVASGLALVMLLGAFVTVRQLTFKPYDWLPYSAQSLAAARAENKVVLVEFTASWCTNCHTLEALVLNRRSVVSTVDRHGVTMIKADLSEDDAAGWSLLKELQQSGVPLTAIYSPKLPEPILLLGIYSTNDLKTAIERASGPEAVASK